MFGNHYTMVDAEPTMHSIFRAIREGRVEPHSPPVKTWTSLRMFFWDPLVARKPGKIMESFPPAASKAG
jgi:hypothetical protein